jgi:hypothetical protein
MESTHRTKKAPSIIVNVIEENNIMCSVIIIDNVERSPTPIVIYSVKGEFDSPTTEYDDKQNLDNNMM